MVGGVPLLKLTTEKRSGTLILPSPLEDLGGDLLHSGVSPWFSEHQDGPSPGPEPFGGIGEKLSVSHRACFGRGTV